MRLYDEPQGGAGEADAMEVPANPTAQNAATAALKPKINTTPVTEALPGVAPIGGQQAAPAGETNPDPNAYAPPPQQTGGYDPGNAAETAVPVAGGVRTSVTPTPPSETGGYDPGNAGLPGPSPSQTQSYNYTGSAANLFPGADGKGQVSGGTDGTGYMIFDQSKSAPMSAADQELHRRIQSGDQALMNEYKQKYGADWFSKWGADQDRLQELDANQTANPSLLAGLNGKSGSDAWSVIGSDIRNLNALRAMSPAQRSQFLSQWPEGSRDRAIVEGSMAAQGITVDNGDTGRRWNGQTQNNGPMASAVPVYQQTGATGGINSQGFAGWPEQNTAGGPGGQVAPGPGQAPATPPLPQPSPSGGANEGFRPAPAGSVLTTNTAGQNTGTPPGTGGYYPGTAGGGTAGGGTGVGGMGNVAQTAVTPQNALTNSLLARQPGADRFKIAQDQWDAFTKATAPEYEAAQRDAMRRAAAGGALGSGMLQTSLGDLAQQRQLAMDTQKQNFLSEALKGTIGDQFADLGIATQQQGFQNQQQQQAFQNKLQELLTSDTLTGSNFNRALQMLTAGSGQNPADLAMTLSQIFGGQSSAAGGSLAALLGGMGQRQASNAPATSSRQPDANSLAAFLQFLKGGGVVPTFG